MTAYFRSIQTLCENEDDLPESALLEQLKSILSTDPDVTHERDGNGYTLLHYAARYRSIEFCQLLVGLNAPAVAVKTNHLGQLPFHNACHKNNVKTAKYLFDLYPECINVSAWNSYYPIHYLLSNHSNYFAYGKKESPLELTQFLLEHDQGAVEKPDTDGWLPLHHACQFHDLNIVKAVFDAYPEAIHIRNHDGRHGGPPFMLATRNRCDETIRTFLYSQLQFISLAEEVITPDGNGQLPIHRVLQSGDASLGLGTIKLMMNANPESISTGDDRGWIPLHIACQVGDIEVVKYLMKVNEGSLELLDLEGNSALHHACLAGNYNVMDCILNKSDHGVSLENADGYLPIQLLLFEANCERESLEFTNAVYALLLAYPAICDIFVE